MNDHSNGDIKGIQQLQMLCIKEGSSALQQALLFSNHHSKKQMI